MRRLSNITSHGIYANVYKFFMNDWSGIRRFCNYLEHASKELDDRVLETQNEIMKLQDILDAISPVPVSEPKEEVRPQRIQQNRKVFRGFDYKVAPKVVATSVDPYGEFLDLLEQYKGIQKFDRAHLADRFTKRLLDFSRTTAAHMHTRMVPCLQRLSQELDKILDYDISQANLKFRAKYTTDKATRVLDEYNRLIDEFGMRRRVDVMTRELQMDEEKPSKKKPDVSDQFEVLANFTPKQLNMFYRLRGNARRLLMSATIKEKAEKTFLDFLSSARVDDNHEEESIAVLKAAQRGFMIIAHDAKAYATIVSP